MSDVEPIRQPSKNAGLAEDSERIMPILDGLASLVEQVRQIHRGGRIHGNIGPATIRRDAVGGLTLESPEESIIFGHAAETIAVFPPEFDAAVPLELPVDLAQGREVLKRHGLPTDPIRIDLYQIGAFVCLEATGENVEAYLRSPKTYARVPRPLRRLIDGALGNSPQTAFATADDLASAVDEARTHCRSDDQRPRPSSTQQRQEAPSSVLEAESVADTTISRRSRSESADDELPFDRLGHYEIVGRIGQGGMGDVYLGYETELDRQVAVKVLPREFARESDFVHRFRREAAAVARLTHPNIVQIYFIGEDDGYLFFAMQLVEGNSLAHRLIEAERLPMDESLRTLRDVLSGLAAAHSQGMVHRDVKPGNVLLEPSGRALLGDFGLVKSQKEMTGRTATGVIMGTVDYIAPEQGRGQAVDGRSDLYATGVMAYQMLSGRLPFEADSPTAMIFQHVYEQPPPLSDVAPGVPPVLQAIVAKLMAKAPADRYQTAEEVLVDLDAFQSGEPLPSGADIVDLDANASLSEEASRPDFRQGPESSAAPATTIIVAPKWRDDRGLEPPPDVPRRRWWSEAAERMQSLLHRHAPQQLLDRIQNTQQQFDGAIRGYERRREELNELVAQAGECLKELKRQERDWRNAIDDAESRLPDAADEQEHQEIVDEAVRAQAMLRILQEQVAEQEEELANMRLQADQLEARIQPLAQQRRLLEARLKAAQAKARIAGGSLSDERLRRHRRRFVSATAAIGLIVLGSIAVLTYRRRQEPPTDPGTEIVKETEPPTADVKASESTPSPLEMLRNIKRAPRRGVLNEDRPLAPVLQFLGHTGDVRAVAYSPDGTILATGGDDGTVRLWDSATAAQLAVFENDLDLRTDRIGFSQLAFSSDGALLACGSSKHRIRLGKQTRNSTATDVRIVDVAERRVIHELQTGPLKLAAMAFVPDAPEVRLSDDDGRLSRWNALTGEPIDEIPLTEMFVGTTAFGSGATTLAQVTPQKTVLWHVDQRTQTREWDNPIFTQEMVERWNSEAESASQGYVPAWMDLSLAYSPDGRWIATGSKESTVRLWDAHTGEQVADLGEIVERVDALAFDPRSRYLAVASSAGGITSEHQIHVWEFEHNRLLVTRLTHEVESLTFHPREPTLVSVGESPQVQKWNVKFPVRFMGEPVKQTPIDFTIVYDYSTSSTGDVLIAHKPFSDKTEYLDLLTRDQGEFRHLERVEAGTRYVSISPDGKRAVAASGNGSLGVWDVRSGRQLRRIHVQLNVEDDQSQSRQYHRIYSLVFLPDNNRVVVATGQTVFIWDTKSGVLTYPFETGPYQPATKLAASPDGRFVAMGRRARETEVGVIRLWEVESGRYLRRMVTDDNEVNCLAFSHDGSYLVSGGKGAIHVWNVETAEEIRRIPVVETAEEIARILPAHIAAFSAKDPETSVRSVAVSPDGRWIAATRYVGAGVWELATGEEVLVYRRAEKSPAHVSFGANGKELICVSNRDVSVWPVNF